MVAPWQARTQEKRWHYRAGLIHSRGEAGTLGKYRPDDDIKHQVNTIIVMNRKVRGVTIHPSCRVKKLFNGKWHLQGQKR